MFQYCFKVSAEACPGRSEDEAPCVMGSCAGEGPADLVDVAYVMGGDVAMNLQVGNIHGAGIREYQVTS